MLAVCTLQPPILQDSSMGLKDLLHLWVPSGQVSITLQIWFGISEVFPSSQLFLAAFPCLTTSIIFSSHYFMGSFYFTGGQLGVFLLCLSSVLVCFQKEFISCQPGLCKDNPSHFYFPFSGRILFTLVTFLCNCSCFHFTSQNVGHWHYTDEIGVMDNTNNISCLAWQCRILHPSLLCGASCRDPKRSDKNFYVFQAAIFSLVNSKSCLELCDVSVSNTKFHPISAALAYDCYFSPSACLCI